MLTGIGSIFYSSHCISYSQCALLDLLFSVHNVTSLASTTCLLSISYSLLLKALSNFKADLYDLLLLDIKMPKMSGIEAYHQMKEIDKKVKVCFITASEIHYYEDITTKIFPIRY